ncbi:MAG: methyltransferase domain-containing protein [Robiginitalea sp.]
MNKFPSFRKRTAEKELMDDMSLSGAELESVMRDLKTVNKLLGGHAVTLKGLLPFLKEKSETHYHILDIGCGDGEFLRYLGGYCRRNDIPVKLTGWDLNAGSLSSAERLSASMEELHFEQKDILRQDSLPEKDTIIVCNLFLHHFTDQQIVRLLGVWKNSDCKAIVINDLHRNPYAYYLFKLFGLIFMKSRIARHDGLVSIRRGFLKRELQDYCRRITGLDCQIRWKWAFRYLCVLSVKNCK